MKIFFVLIESRIDVEELIGFDIVVGIAKEQSEEDRETENLNSE
jgi:hypothetical protein